VVSFKDKTWYQPVIEILKKKIGYFKNPNGNIFMEIVTLRTGITKRAL